MPGAWSDSIWSNGVCNNVHTASVELGDLEWGTHTIRIYAQDPALVLQKIVLYSSRRLPTSCLGAPERYPSESNPSPLHKLTLLLKYW